jgi:hypothetical protein
MQIVGTYRNKDTVRAYPALLALADSAVMQGCDFLGSVATQMEVLNAQIGQFFTPWEVARLMASITLENPGGIIAEKGFLTLQEPASGAGGMVLAAADVLAQQAFDPGLHMLVHAIDVSPLCFHMTYLQLSLRGIPALVEHGNTLSGERFARAWTIATNDFYLRHGRLFPEPTAEERAAEEMLRSGEQLVLL